MRKLFAVIFAMLLALPTVALAQETSSSVPEYIRQYISEDEAKRIVESWGIRVTDATLVPERYTWIVYGTYTFNLGPSIVRMNTAVTLHAYDGSFVSMEIRKNTSDGMELVRKRLSEMGINIHSMNYVSDRYKPYWEVVGSKSIDFSGFSFTLNLYIRLDTSGNIIEMRQDDMYRILPIYDDARTLPVWGGLAEMVFPNEGLERAIGNSIEPVMGTNSQTIRPEPNVIVDPYENDVIVVVD